MVPQDEWNQTDFENVGVNYLHIILAFLKLKDGTATNSRLVVMV